MAVDTRVARLATPRLHVDRRILGYVYPLVAVAGLIIWFSASSPVFLTLSNFENIGRQTSVLMLVALGGTFAILIGSIDLSVGGIVTVAGLLCATVVDRAGFLPAVLTAVGFGAAVGAVNGSLMLLFRIPSFLVTLGTLSVLTGIGIALANGAPIYFTNTTLPHAVNASSVLGIPNNIALTAVVLIILTVMAARTRFGRALYAIGGGEPVAAVAGIPVNRYKVGAFILTGTLCGLAAVVATGQVGAGTLDVGSSLLLQSIAAVVMGGTALSGGVGGPIRTLLGVAVIEILSNGMDVLGIGQATQNIVTGAVIIAAVALSIDRSKYSLIK